MSLSPVIVDGQFSSHFEEPCPPAQRLPIRADLALVIPTYNERGNIPELLARIELALSGLVWELIFVDDDSPDGTSQLIAEYARQDARIRLVHRIGRRGLSTACVEGALASTSNYIAIMDADLQHDEAILPRMLERMRAESLDLVVGTRNAEGGSMGQFCRSRVLLSRLGKRISHTVCRCDISDPMSGFFLVSRSFFLEVVHRLQGSGFKILVDMLSCADRPVRFREVGYTFRERRHGESKLDMNTAVEYLVLVLDKLTRGFLPMRLTGFLIVGAAGLVTHLLLLTLLYKGLHWHFVSAQLLATYAAMTENFFLNNLITWRDRSLRGVRLVSGLASFWLACSFGAWADVVFAHTLLLGGTRWLTAGIAGIVLSSGWNYTISSLFVWQAAARQTTQQDQSLEASYTSNPLI